MSKPMKDLIRKLLDRLDAIAEEHEEVGDTAVREAMSAAIFSGFLRPVEGFVLPGEFEMFSDEGNRSVRQALTKFLASAGKMKAEALPTSFHDRLAAFQDGSVESAEGTSCDEYFGWADPEGFDDSGSEVGTPSDPPL